MAEQDPETLSKLSNFNLQDIFYHQMLQNRQKPAALPHPALQTNGNLLRNGNESDLHNSQAYLMNSFLASQESKPNHINYTNHTNEEEEETMNGISRTNSPTSSSHSSEFHFSTAFQQVLIEC